MKTRTKNKAPVFSLIFGIILASFVAENWTETEHMLHVLFGSTPSYLQRYFVNRPRDFIYPAALILAVLFLFSAIMRIMRGSKEKQGSLTQKKDHTHDRTDTVAYDRHESQTDHYIKQLDGFLKAGIIDRSEYNQLIRRYKG
ncbi:MAG: hypothetical protein IJ237_06755 [Oscillospiraceae bacterium]|nr:hypothetical protein [Oscillospiraceae bacterium]